MLAPNERRMNAKKILSNGILFFFELADGFLFNKFLPSLMHDLQTEI
jgi:hypothetical protein